MYEAVQQCKHCGAGLSLDDLRKPDCTYCGTVFPHHAQSAQHAQLIGQAMGQMMQQQAHIQNQWRGAFGVGPVPPGGPPGSPYGHPAVMAHAQMARSTSRMVLVIVVVSMLVVVLMVGVFVGAWLLF